ncbi:MAG: Mut7-C RNAse domain-containing protein [Candidatus Zixiibacteriota bacterium]
MGSEPKFACDDHCGRLARWLRILGFDCTHDQTITDAALLTAALAEERIILTRDARLAERTLARRRILLDSPDPLKQVVQVLQDTRTTVDDGRLFTRCTLCNQPTDPTELAAVIDRVPPYVQKTQTTFRLCPSCGRVFWRGTHVQRMLKRLQATGIIPWA